MFFTYGPINATRLTCCLNTRVGRKVAIEIKSSDRVSKTDFKNIEWFKQVNAGAPIQGVILYCGNEVQEYDNGNVALPIAKFWMD